MTDPEICICAAIRLGDGRIIRGHRHNDCLRALWGIPIKDRPMERPEQGFVTSRNRFVNRKDGQRLQLSAGIPSMNGYRGDELYSEDLY